MVTGDLVGLWPLLALNDVKFDFVAFLQTFVTIDLNCAVVNEDIRSVISSYKAVTLRIVEPLHLTLILSHEPYPSLKQITVGDRHQPA